MSSRYFDRRTFLAGAGVGWLLPAAARAESNWTPAMPGTAFGFEQVDDMAATLAETPMRPNAKPLPEAMAQLTPQDYHAIRFRPEASLWRDEDVSFEVQFFPRGSYFHHAVTVNVLDGDSVTPLPYSPDVFDFSGAGLSEMPPQDLGFAGFRLMYPLNGEERLDELAVFLGASYFRVLAAGQHYGLSARGLAIDTGLAKKEEFPYFREFWLRKPQRSARSIEIFALLDSPSLTGAYHFRLTPGSETVMDVRCRLYTRSAVEKLGLAPLTSMFLFGENTSRPIDDLRPEVHDSDGMLMASGHGEWIWRPLANRDALEISSFADESPRGFGLMQRDRDSRHYQDLDFNYERRPCAWVEPQGAWGKGVAQLIEIPSDSERYDNIGLFWVPDRPVEAGQTWPFAYRLRFASSYPDFPANGRALATREASGSDEGLRRFAIEFGGGPLSELTPDSPVQLVVSTSHGKILKSESRRSAATGSWFAHFELDPEGEDAVELRAFLKDRDHALTETWSYLWKRG
ncbi:glucan biosynthesis protein G [Pelagibius sp. CAU 1746]|uniref:glucan biosynthesis protein n=1 Tax=Pelagibius sp. CAU 1746 TaxID=3140370 RepID=UPI00325B8D9A